MLLKSGQCCVCVSLFLSCLCDYSACQWCTGLNDGAPPFHVIDSGCFYSLYVEVAIIHLVSLPLEDTNYVSLIFFY